MQFVQDALNKKKGKKMRTPPSDTEMSSYYFYYKLEALLGIVNTITNDSNPVFIKKQIEQFKKEWETRDEF